MDQESEGIRENPSQLNQNLNQIIEFNINTGTECCSKDARERDSPNIDPDQIKIDELIANTNEINLCANASETESHQFDLIFDLAQKYQEQLYAESHGTNNEAEASIYDIAYYTDYCLHECECMLFSYTNTYDTSLHEEFPIEPKRIINRNGREGTRTGNDQEKY